MHSLSQSPTDPAFVQDPYPVYDRARAMGPLVFWEDYAMPAAFAQPQVHALLRDRRFGRERPADMPLPTPADLAHLAPWLAVEAHSLLDAEPPRHTRLRGLILRAFTSRRITAMGPDIHQLCHDLVDAFPDGDFDLLSAYCTAVPVTVICRLLGVPEADAGRMLDWSHRMVAMYQATRTRATEESAAEASAAFTAYLRAYIDDRRAAPGNDLITQLIAAEEDGTKLSTDELIGTCILLLNAGHEATVHGLGNGVKTMLQQGLDPAWLTDTQIAATVEEILRYDPPLHMFTRYAYEDIDLFGHSFKRGDQVALMLGAANRDPSIWSNPHTFDPARPQTTHTSLGGGLHFCVGAPLARLEMQIALPILFDRCPTLSLAETPAYADTYHFHGLTRLMVTR
ncbi:MAG: cytochrome P450 [Rhodobacteraceae bacterium]|nr:cytochrome P450 [Paracoccaceae bacterium]MAY44574.1 cytochrome P450 [Paracoccaceae bacterium]